MEGQQSPEHPARSVDARMAIQYLAVQLSAAGSDTDRPSRSTRTDSAPAQFH